MKSYLICECGRAVCELTKDEGRKCWYLFMVLPPVRHSAHKMERSGGHLSPSRQSPLLSDRLFIVHKFNYVYCIIWLSTLRWQVEDCRYANYKLYIRSFSGILSTPPLNKFGNTKSKSVEWKLLIKVWCWLHTTQLIYWSAILVVLCQVVSRR